jgi:predicted GIY-YIG superfamily endonuclease
MQYTLYVCKFKNNKKYVGITRRKLEQRIKDHIKTAKRDPKYAFHRALIKYNFDVTWETLCTGLSKDKAIKMEMDTIKAYGSYVLDNGYNSTLGGEGVKVITCKSWEEKERIAKENGKKPFFVKKDGKVLGTYYSSYVVTHKYNVLQPKLRLCLLGLSRGTRGYEFEYCENPKKFTPFVWPKKERKIKTKSPRKPRSREHSLRMARTKFKGVLVAVKGDFYKEYLSVKECLEDLGLNRNSVLSCIAKKRNSLFGYTFSKKEL